MYSLKVPAVIAFKRFWRIRHWLAHCGLIRLRVPSFAASLAVAGAGTAWAAPPDAPTIGTATAGSGQASVTFTAPVNDGGSAIQYYTATADPGGAFGSCPGPAACTATVTGLDNGTSYTFTVTATNATETSAPSGASNSVTPQANQTITFANPGTQLFGTSPTLGAASDSSLTVSFTSSTTGVCTITNSGVLTFISAGSCTINANQPGDSAFLAATQVSRTFTVAAVIPGAPTIGTAMAGDTQASVSFTAPLNTGGTTVTGYTVIVSPADVAPVNGNSSPIVVNGLTNGQAYTFTVTADNAAGTGPASSASNSITPAATQTITFNNPGQRNFGTTPTLSATSDSGLIPSFTSSTPAVCTITSGGALTFVIAGTCTINADQPGDGSYLPATQVSRSFTVNAVLPGAPTIGTVVAGNGQAKVSFTPPAFSGGTSITGYLVTATTVPGGVDTTTTGSMSPITFTGLANGTAYTFKVSAVNSVGSGAASSPSANITPVAPEDPPTPLAGGSITVDPGSSGALTAPATANLGSGSTLTVQASAAGGFVTPPASGVAMVRLGDAGSSVSVAQVGSGGQAVVLRNGSGNAVLGLQSGSLMIAASQAGQVMLDVGTPIGSNSTASGQQVVAGLRGGRVLAQRAGDGSITVQVLEGTASIPCAGPCVNSPTTVIVLAGEAATFDRLGLAQRITVATLPLTSPLPAGLQLSATPADLSKSIPARTPGVSLLEQASAALQAMLGSANVPSAVQLSPLGTLSWAQPGGTTLGLLPLAPPYVDLNAQNGASLDAAGTLLIAFSGVVQTFGAAPADLGAAVQAMQALVPGAQLTVNATGTWRIRGSGGLELSLRPAWLGNAGTPTGHAPRFELDDAGRLWLVEAGGVRTSFMPALAEPRALQNLLRSADPQLQWRIDTDGTAKLVLYGQAYVLVPQPVLSSMPGNDAVWLEPKADGGLLLRVRLADGSVQTLLVNLP